MKSLDSLLANGFWHSFSFRKNYFVKTAMLLFSVGCCVWLVSEYFYPTTLNEITTREFRQDVRQQASINQQKLNNAFKAFGATAQLYALYTPLQEQLLEWQLSDQDISTPYQFRHRPHWLLNEQDISGSISIDYALLLDSKGRLLATYGQDPKTISTQLTRSDAGLLMSNHNDSVIQRLGQSDYLIKAAGITSNKQELGQLILVTRVDKKFLETVIGEKTSYIINALVDVQNGQLVASNGTIPDPVIPNMTKSHPFMELMYQERLGHLKAGRNLAFMTWFDTSNISGLNQAFTRNDRKQRLAILTIFSLVLFGLVFRIQQRLKRIQKNILDYGTKLGVQIKSETDDDLIDTINNQIKCFGDEIIAETTALEYQALHDPLTSLPNRSRMLEKLNEEISHCESSNQSLALLITDLDRFKEVNDTLGHHMGDRLLQEVGRRLTTLLRHTDMVARLGGDEFAIILSGADQDQVNVVCKKITAIMKRPIVVDSMPLRVGISIGAVICPEHGNSASLLMRRADIAMYEAKHDQTGYAIYSASKDKSDVGRLGLSSELHEAIEQDQLTLEYQPLIDMKTNKISCVEALVRWQHPSMGLVQPDEFILLAEQTGVIRPLTLWVIDHALAQAARWGKAGLSLRISINLSVRCLQDRRLPMQVEQLLAKHQITPDHIVLEVTESAIMSDPVTARRVMRRLSNMGFHLSIDDFGTGYSSLSYLKQLPVDEIKIDKSFVMDMHENESDAVIVRATIDLAHNLGLKVVAEGVENDKVWNDIMSLGCDTAQGYYIRKPAGASELVRWIRARRNQENGWVSVQEACAD